MKALLILISFLLVLSCRPVNVEAVRSIEGVYQATYYDQFSRSNDPMAYPINGQELSLQIKYVATDTVSVQIIPSTATTALPAGIYSPTQTLSYPKAYAELSSNGGTYIYLMGKSNGPVSVTNPQIWIYSDRRRADYLFTPTQTPNFSKAICFEKN